MSVKRHKRAVFTFTPAKRNMNITSFWQITPPRTKPTMYSTKRIHYPPLFVEFYEVRIPS